MGTVRCQDEDYETAIVLAGHLFPPLLRLSCDTEFSSRRIRKYPQIILYRPTTKEIKLIQLSPPHPPPEGSNPFGTHHCLSISPQISLVPLYDVITSSTSVYPSK